MHQIYQTNDSAKMCQVVKNSFLPLKKPRNSNAKSGDTGNAMIAIPDAIRCACSNSAACSATEGIRTDGRRTPAVAFLLP